MTVYCNRHQSIEHNKKPTYTMTLENRPFESKVQEVTDYISQPKQLKNLDRNSSVKVLNHHAYKSIDTLIDDPTAESQKSTLKNKIKLNSHQSQSNV